MSASASAAPSRVGMFHRMADTSGPLVGRHVAVEGLLAALHRHLRAIRCELFADPRELPSLRRQLDAAGAALPVHDQRGLAQPGAVDALGLSAWHDPALETRRPFALPERAARPYPGHGAVYVAPRARNHVALRT